MAAFGCVTLAFGQGLRDLGLETVDGGVAEEIEPARSRVVPPLLIELGELALREVFKLLAFDSERLERLALGVEGASLILDGLLWETKKTS